MAEGWDRITAAARDFKATERERRPAPDGPRSLHKQPALQRTAPLAPGRFNMYHSPAADRTMGRTQEALDKTKFLTDGRVQDVIAESGTKRSTAMSILDNGPHINVNHMRFQRQQGTNVTLKHDGGWNYNPQVCVGNWGEERQEPGYSSGFHARELGFTKRYETEHNAAFKPHQPEYREQIVEEGLVAKPMQLRAPVKNGNHSDGKYVYYANKGFGPKHHMDHTAPYKRGSYYVGNAPHRKHETLTMTQQKQEPIEFQFRNPVYDLKAKMLAYHPQDEPGSATMQRTMHRLAQSQRHTVNWQSMYKTEFKDRSRRAQTAQPGYRSEDNTWLGVTLRPTTALQ